MTAFNVMRMNQDLTLSSFREEQGIFLKRIYSMNIELCRRNSGIPSAIQRPPDQVYNMEHCYWYGDL